MIVALSSVSAPTSQDDNGGMPPPNEITGKYPDILGGTPVFQGTRVPFQALLDYLEAAKLWMNFRWLPSSYARGCGGVARVGQVTACRPIWMNILLDECIRGSSKTYLTDHNCRRLPEAGLAGKTSTLLPLAEGSGFQVFVRMDKASCIYQNLAGLQPHLTKCLDLIRSIQPGQIVRV